MQPRLKPLVEVFSLCPCKYRTYGTSTITPVPFLVLLYSMNLYWTLILCQAVGSILGRNSAQEKKCSWENVWVLMNLGFLHMLSTLRFGAWFLLAEKVGLLMPCSWIWHLCPYIILHLSRTLRKHHSHFSAPHCVLDSLKYLENLLVLPSHHLKKENLGFCFLDFFSFLCANFLFFPLCVFSSQSWVIYGLLSLWNIFL